MHRPAGDESVSRMRTRPDSTPMAVAWKAAGTARKERRRGRHPWIEEQRRPATTNQKGGPTAGRRPDSGQERHSAGPPAGGRPSARTSVLWGIKVGALGGR
ncbi:hypothetical protein AB1Y20_015908 [Prymnesium parvum]|uniref:Uncharacterized protein n=1 Tax=Prymnesium parvum TaxID=97485 RepID=A0AB34K2E1_PRYPA